MERRPLTHHWGPARCAARGEGTVLLPWENHANRAARLICPVLSQICLLAPSPPTHPPCVGLREVPVGDPRGQKVRGNCRQAFCFWWREAGNHQAQPFEPKCFTPVSQGLSTESPSQGPRHSREKHQGLLRHPFCAFTFGCVRLGAVLKGFPVTL